ncbi:MAG: hypothetical protein RR014_03390 [Bilophila sp.]
MKPMYQGQIDVFCAAYAVVNAMRHLRAIRLLTCRELFHEALLDLARDEHAFRDALNQETDYTRWVDSMLERQKRLGGLQVQYPFPLDDTQPAGMPQDPAFPPAQDISLEELWATLGAWFAGGTRRAALFQFVRYIFPNKTQIRHWTCCCSMEDTTLRLYDSSLDAGALHHLERDWLITDAHNAIIGNVLIVPYTVRLLRSRFEQI